MLPLLLKEQIKWKPKFGGLIKIKNINSKKTSILELRFFYFLKMKPDPTIKCELTK